MSNAAIGAIGTGLGEVGELGTGLLNVGMRGLGTAYYADATSHIPEAYRNMAIQYGQGGTQRAFDTNAQIRGSNDAWMGDVNNPFGQAGGRNAPNLSYGEAQRTGGYAGGATGIAQQNYDDTYSLTRDAMGEARAGASAMRESYTNTVAAHMDDFSQNAYDSIEQGRQRIAEMTASGLPPAAAAQLEFQNEWQAGENLGRQAIGFMANNVQTKINTELAASKLTVDTYLQSTALRTQSAGMVQQGFEADRSHATALQQWREGVIANEFTRLGQADAIAISLEQTALSMEMKRAGDIAAMIAGMASPLMDPNNRFDAGNVVAAYQQGQQMDMYNDANSDTGWF